jgi:transposase InsO family protein
VLFFIELASRRVHFRWLRNEPIRGLGRPTSAEPQFHQCLRADAFPDSRSRSKFTAAFDEVFRSEGLTVIHTPVRASQANAYAERFIRTVRNECLDWLLIVGRGHLKLVLRIYIQHYNRERPNRGLALQPPEPRARASAARTAIGHATARRRRPPPRSPQRPRA